MTTRTSLSSSRRPRRTMSSRSLRLPQLYLFSGRIIFIIVAICQQLGLNNGVSAVTYFIPPSYPAPLIPRGYQPPPAGVLADEYAYGSPQLLPPSPSQPLAQQYTIMRFNSHEPYPSQQQKQQQQQPQIPYPEQQSAPFQHITDSPPLNERRNGNGVEERITPPFQRIDTPTFINTLIQVYSRENAADDRVALAEARQMTSIEGGDRSVDAIANSPRRVVLTKQLDTHARVFLPTDRRPIQVTASERADELARFVAVKAFAASNSTRVSNAELENALTRELEVSIPVIIEELERLQQERKQNATATKDRPVTPPTAIATLVPPRYPVDEHSPDDFEVKNPDLERLIAEGLAEVDETETARPTAGHTSAAGANDAVAATTTADAAESTTMMPLIVFTKTSSLASPSTASMTTAQARYVATSTSAELERQQTVTTLSESPVILEAEITRPFAESIATVAHITVTTTVPEKTDEVHWITPHEVAEHHSEIPEAESTAAEGETVSDVVSKTEETPISTPGVVSEVPPEAETATATELKVLKAENTRGPELTTIAGSEALVSKTTIEHLSSPTDLQFLETSESERFTFETSQPEIMATILPETSTASSTIQSETLTTKPEITQAQTETVLEIPTTQSESVTRESILAVEMEATSTVDQAELTTTTLSEASEQTVVGGGGGGGGGEEFFPADVTGSASTEPILEVSRQEESAPPAEEILITVAPSAETTELLAIITTESKTISGIEELSPTTTVSENAVISSTSNSPAEAETIEGSEASTVADFSNDASPSTAAAEVAETSVPFVTSAFGTQQPATVESGAPKEEEEEEEEEHCPSTANGAGVAESGRRRGDVLFLLDSSRSVGEERFRRALKLIHETVAHLAGRQRYGADGIQVSLIQFNSEPFLEFSFRRHRCLDNALADIDDTRFMAADGAPNLTRAIERAMRYAFTSSRGDRTDAENVLVLVTDGQSESDYQIQVPVELTQHNATTLLVVATFDARPEELADLATDRPQLFNLTAVRERVPLAERLADRIRQVLDGKHLAVATTLPSSGDGSLASMMTFTTVGSGAEDASAIRFIATTQVPAISSNTDTEASSGDSGGDSAMKSIADSAGIGGGDDDVTVDCLAGGVRVTFHLPTTFSGFVAAKGFIDHPQCVQQVRPADDGSTGRRSVLMEVHHPNCGLHFMKSVSPRGINESIVLSVLHNQRLETAADRSYIVQCFIPLESTTSAFAGGADTAFSVDDNGAAEKTFEEQRLDADLNVLPGMALSKTIAVVGAAPQCHYTLRRDSPNGPVLQEAVIGQMLYHRWECARPEKAGHQPDVEPSRSPLGDDVSSIFGLRIHDCVAHSQTGDDRASPNVTYQFVDANGCSSDGTLLGEVTYAPDRLMAYARAYVFTLRNVGALRFTCKVGMCLRNPGDGNTATMTDGCADYTPPICNGGASASQDDRPLGADTFSFDRQLRQMDDSGVEATLGGDVSAPSLIVLPSRMGDTSGSADTGIRMLGISAIVDVDAEAPSVAYVVGVLSVAILAGVLLGLLCFALTRCCHSDEEEDDEKRRRGRNDDCSGSSLALSEEGALAPLPADALSLNDAAAPPTAASSADVNRHSVYEDAISGRSSSGSGGYYSRNILRGSVGSASKADDGAPPKLYTAHPILAVDDETAETESRVA